MVKKLNKWVPRELTENLKNHFEVLSSLILHNREPFLDGIVMYDEKWILYSNQRWPAQGMDWEAALKHFPKPNLHQKNIMVIVAGLIHYSLLNPGESITSEKFAQQNWWDAMRTATPAAIICQQKGPNSSPQQCPTACHTTNASKVEWIGLQSFASSASFTWLLTKWLILLQASWQLFAGKRFPQTAWHRPRVHQILKPGFHATRIIKLISHWQKCVDSNSSYFD